MNELSPLERGERQPPWPVDPAPLRGWHPVRRNNPQQTLFRWSKKLSLSIVQLRSLPFPVLEISRISRRVRCRCVFGWCPAVMTLGNRHRRSTLDPPSSGTKSVSNILFL